MNKETVEKKFKKSGLRIKVEDGAVNRNEDIFGLRVDGFGSNEIFVMQLGAKDNDVQIVDTDAKAKQVLMMVNEPERVYKEKVWSQRERKHVEVERTTDANKRKFLVGMDERSYFMAPVADNAINIGDAKDKLRNPNLKNDRKTKRQGEWFFQPVNDQEAIDVAIRKGEGIVRKKAGIGTMLGSPGGKPHVADELVRIRKTTVPEDVGPEPKTTKSMRQFLRDRRMSQSVMDSDQFFVRGKIRHPDHKTVEFSQWTRVLPNMEERRVAVNGVSNWID